MRTTPGLESHDVVKLNDSLNYSLLSGARGKYDEFFTGNSGEIRFKYMVTALRIGR